MEELGFETPIKKIFNFTYRANFSNGLTEYEFDHVFYGVYDGEIKADHAEVMDVKFITHEDLTVNMQRHPASYTAWFKIAFPKIELYQTLALNQ